MNLAAEGEIVGPLAKSPKIADGAESLQMRVTAYDMLVTDMHSIGHPCSHLQMISNSGYG